MTKPNIILVLKGELWEVPIKVQLQKLEQLRIGSLRVGARALPEHPNRDLHQSLDYIVYLINRIIHYEPKTHELLGNSTGFRLGSGARLLRGHRCRDGPGHLRRVHA